MVAVREATAGDAPAIAAVHVASWKAGYEGLLPSDYLERLVAADRLPWWTGTLALPPCDRPLRVLVVEDDDGRICGLGSTLPPDGGASAVLAQLYLEPSAWGTGAADDLLSALVGGLADVGVRTVALGVARENGRARRFYERHGWELVGGSDAVEDVWGVEVVTVTYRLQVGE